MLCVTVQPHSVAQTLRFDNYVNRFKYPEGTAESRFKKQFKYNPIFVIPVKTAIDAYCHMLINQTMFGEDMILFTANEFFEVAMDEWHSMLRGDKKVLSQIQSPIRETIVPKIYNRDVHGIYTIPLYTKDLVYNYLIYCLSGSPYMTLCNYMHEVPHRITEATSDSLSSLLQQKRFYPLLTTSEILDPNLFDEFKTCVKNVLEKGE